MVSLKVIQASNSLISTSLPSKLIAVFVGATSGIGETSLKQFAKHTVQPRIYFIGRSQTSADRIVQECKTINPAGEYTFIKSDASLIREVDSACEKIREREKEVNLLFMSQGVIEFGRTKTEENLDLTFSLDYYSRIRFILNLLPLISTAPYLRRIVSVFAGTKEGPIFENDWQCANVSLLKVVCIRGHMVSMMDFGFEALAKQNPNVSFVHDYPGYVDTGIMEKSTGKISGVVKGLQKLRKRFLNSKDKYIPIEECGERHLYLATSKRYGVGEKGEGVGLGEGVEIARGSDGTVGSGVYAVDEFGESSVEGEKVLDGMRRDGMVEKVWRHTEEEFKRIVG